MTGMGGRDVCATLQRHSAPVWHSTDLVIGHQCLLEELESLGSLVKTSLHSTALSTAAATHNPMNHSLTPKVIQCLKEMKHCHNIYTTQSIVCFPQNNIEIMRCFRMY